MKFKNRLSVNVFICCYFIMVSCLFAGESVSTSLSSVTESEDFINETLSTFEKQNRKNYADFDVESAKNALIEKMYNDPSSRSNRSVWYSTDPSDLEPLKGTVWKFSYTITSSFTDTITFANNIKTMSDGTVVLGCTNDYGYTGSVFYTDMGFSVVIMTDTLNFFYFFDINNYKATGTCVFEIVSSGDYSDAYNLTGNQISPPPTQPTLSITPNSRSASKDAGTTSFSVSNTGTGTMSWTASVTSESSWLRITSGTSGKNTGTIYCEFDANSTTSPRTGIIRVTATGAKESPKDVKVIQDGDDLLPPTVNTVSATSISSSSATLNGTVNPNGSSTTYYFEYGKTTSYGSSTPAGDAGSGKVNKNVSINLTGLSENTTYHYRIVAYNDAGTTNGYDQTFTTNKTVVINEPSVTTGIADSITESSATLHGSVNPNGASTTYYFEYGITTSYGDETTSQSAGSGNSINSLSGIINGLNAKTTYYFRIVATNSQGTSYGNYNTFTTTASSPDLPEAINTYITLTKSSPGLFMPYGIYASIFGSSDGDNTINVQSGAKVQCQNFVGNNTINIEDSSYDFTVYRSGATVYLENSGTRTLIKIPATSKSQTLRFIDGSSILSINGSKKVMIGWQEITPTKVSLEQPANSDDTSESIF